MANLIYSAITSLDGYLEDDVGKFDWAAPDDEVHAFVNDLERPIGTHLLVLCYVADFACHDIRRRIPSLPQTHDALDRGSMDFDPGSGYLTKHY